MSYLTLSCQKSQRKDTVRYECRRESGHAGEHDFVVAPLEIRFNLIDDKAVAALAEDLNRDPRDRRYSNEQIKLGLWKMIDALVDSLDEHLVDMVDGKFVHNFRHDLTEYMGEPELPPSLAEQACHYCSKPIGEDGVGAAVLVGDAEERAMHLACYHIALSRIKNKSGNGRDTEI